MPDQLYKGPPLSRSDPLSQFGLEVTLMRTSGMSKEEILQELARRQHSQAAKQGRKKRKQKRPKSKK